MNPNQQLADVEKLKKKVLSFNQFGSQQIQYLTIHTAYLSQNNAI